MSDGSPERHETPSLSAMMARQGAANVAIQLATLVSKSLLLFVLARYLSVADVGAFGLVVVTLSLGVHLLGLDFYAFSTRELLAARPEQVPCLLRDQFLFHLVTYPAAVLVAALIFLGGTLPWGLLVLFIALLLTEHLGQEMQRALVTLGRPVQGAFVVFLRAGLWVWVAAAALATQETGSEGLTLVLQVWLAGSVAGILLAFLFLRDLPWGELSRRSVDWAWVRRGLRVAAPFLLASFAFRGLLAIDRYALQYAAGLEAVGVYSFYANFRNAILSFVEMGILFVYRPRVISAHQNRESAHYRQLLSRMGRLLIAAPMLLGLAAGVVVVPLLHSVGEPAYGEHLAVLWLILLSAVLASAAEIPHTVLYAQHRDRALVSSTVLTLLAAIPLHLMAARAWGILGTGAASAASFGLLAGAKLWLARRDPETA